MNRITINHSKMIKSLIAAAVVLSLPFLGSNANASQCVVGQVKEVGTWINPDINTRNVTKAVFGEECRDASTVNCNGNICTVTSAVKLVYTAKVWGKCHPTDCYWGKVDGVYTSAKWLRFVYEPSFARKTVWGQIKSGDNNRLRLIVDTHFTDSSGREDYQTDTWMKRQ